MKNKILIITFLILCFSAKAQVTVTYTYDNLNRLTQASYSNGVGIQYSYDALGNRTQESKTSTLSIEEITTEKKISLYPNPFVEELTISAKDQNISHVQLFDMTGKLVHDENINQQNMFTLKTNSLPKGTYIISIITDIGKESYKIIKK